MARTQNGWLHLTSDEQRDKYLTVIEIPDTRPVRKFRVRKGNVAVVFRWFLTQFHEHVESLNEGHPNDDWSYADRPVRGGSSTSNHASGTAVDANATQHPLGTSPYANFSNKQISNIHGLLHRARRVIRWGGDYSGRKDPMHFEINASAGAVADLADWIRAQDRPAEPKELPDVKMDYYPARPVTIKAEGPDIEPQHLQFDRREEGAKSPAWWLGVVSSGDKGQPCHVTLGMTFDNDGLPDDEIVEGRVIWTVHEENGHQHTAYEATPFRLSKWTKDSPKTAPGRQATVHQSCRVYGPGRFLRAAVELPITLRLESGQARVTLYKEN